MFATLIFNPENPLFKLILLSDCPNIKYEYCARGVLGLEATKKGTTILKSELQKNYLKNINKYFAKITIPSKQRLKLKRSLTPEIQFQNEIHLLKSILNDEYKFPHYNNSFKASKKVFFKNNTPLNGFKA